MQHFQTNTKKIFKKFQFFLFFVFSCLMFNSNDVWAEKIFYPQQDTYRFQPLSLGASVGYSNSNKLALQLGDVSNSSNLEDSSSGINISVSINVFYNVRSTMVVII